MTVGREGCEPGVPSETQPWDEQASGGPDGARPVREPRWDSAGQDGGILFVPVLDAK